MWRKEREVELKVNRNYQSEQETPEKSEKWREMFGKQVMKRKGIRGKKKLENQHSVCGRRS